MEVEFQSEKAPSDTSGPVPVVVDLDGTLVHGDTLWESFFSLPRHSPLGFLTATYSLVRGRAAFKAEVAKQFKPHLNKVVFNEELIEFLRKEAYRRPIILATASHITVANSIADELQFFNEVLASDESNLKGRTKLRAVENCLAANNWLNGFDYIGDSGADRPLWAKARKAFAVAPSVQQAKRVSGGINFERIFVAPAAGPRAYIKGMRPHQWVKNLLIFAPLLLSRQFAEIDVTIEAVIAFLAFNLCASATYLWNDILDVQLDRVHPRKRSRPFASGAIRIPQGLLFSAALMAAGFGLIIAFLPMIVVGLFLFYIVFTLTYSLYLKEKLLVDAMALGLLYSLRILIGAGATGVVVSDWLIAFSTFFFFGLALVKRYSEIAISQSTTHEKIAGRGYYAHDVQILSMLGVAASFVSILILALYITSDYVLANYTRPQALWFVCLVMMYWVSRVWVLASRKEMPDDPIVFALRDPISLTCGVLCGCAVVVAT